VSENETPEITVRGMLVAAVALVGGVAYLAAGVAYASSESVDIAGLTGAAYYIAWAMQVLAWPLLLWTHS
jgi:uncharacterized membrane protein YhiD involved in acid resistance